MRIEAKPIKGKLRRQLETRYGNKSRRKPINSSGLILNGIPHVIPLDFK